MHNLIQFASDRMDLVTEKTFQCVKKAGEANPVVLKNTDGSAISSSAECVKAKGVWEASAVVEKKGDMNGIVINIINAILGIVGLIAVVMIILGGISYMTSSGDSAKVKKGKDTILYGVIGLVIVGLAYAIVNFVLSSILG